MFGFNSSPVLFLAVAALFFALILYTVIRGSRHWNLKKKNRKISAEAVVEKKRTDLSGSRVNTLDGHVPVTCFVSFRLSGGEVLELAVDAASYGRMSEGDRGILTFRDSCFIGFEA